MQFILRLRPEICTPAFYFSPDQQQHHMRLIVCLFILCCTTFLPLQAQPDAKELAKHQKAVTKSARNNEAIISLDTLYKSGQPFAKVRRKNQYDYAYQLVSLQGEPLFWTDIETGSPASSSSPYARNWRVFTFMIDSVAESSALPLGLKWTDNDLAREIFRYGLVDAEGLNRANVIDFIDRYRSNVPQKDYTLQSLVLPARDRSKLLFRQSRTTIIQDGVQIAMIWQRKLRGSDEMAAKIYNTEGRRFTSFMFLPDALNTLEFETSIDGRFHKIEVTADQDPVLEVAAYLVAKGYL